MSRSHLQQARAVLLRAKKGKQAPEDSKHGNERIKGDHHQIVGTPLSPLTTAPIEATKKYEIIGGRDPNTSCSSSVTKKAKRAAAGKKKEPKKKGVTSEEIAAASKELA